MLTDLGIDKDDFQSVSDSVGHATGRDRGPPLLRRPRGGAGRRPAAVSDKCLERFRVKRKCSR